jgi:S-(hydroxymethyl)glutathione dehydrogenase/alcohol dehydrogenase
MHFRAAVLREVGSPLVVETLKVKDPADADVIVRIAATSLCHTDLEAVAGHLGVPLPFVPGHEAAGIVEWTGSAVQRCKPGDHVVLSWNPHCNECFYCRTQQPILCEQYRGNAASAFHFDGRRRLEGGNTPVHQLMYTGSFAEMAVVSEDCAISIPAAMPFDRACLIGCGVMTGVGAVLNVAKVSPGSSISVIGCGAVGLSAIQGARLADAERIIAIDRDPQKLALAKAMGATHVLSANDSLLAAHADLTHGRGADCVIEAAGNPQSFQSSVDLVRPGGQIVWLGKLPVSHQLSLRWGSLMGEKRIVRASYGGANPIRDFPMLANAYLDGRLKLDEYITSRVRLEDVNEGLDRLNRGLEIRSVIEF